MVKLDFIIMITGISYFGFIFFVCLLNAPRTGADMDRAGRQAFNGGEEDKTYPITGKIENVFANGALGLCY